MFNHLINVIKIKTKAIAAVFKKRVKDSVATNVTFVFATKTLHSYIDIP